MKRRTKYAIGVVVVLCIIIAVYYTLTAACVLNNKVMCGKYSHVVSQTMFSLELPGGYKIFNPSIVRTKDGWVMSIRYSKQTKKNAALYMYAILDTESYVGMILFDKDFKIKKFTIPIFNKFPLQDPRVTRHKGRFYVSVAEIFERTNVFPCLYTMDDNFNDVKKIEYNKDDYFGDKEHTKMQKNWCPFTHKKKLVVHTDTYPRWKAYSVSKTGRMKLLVDVNSSYIFRDCGHKNVRCSTSWKSYSKTTYLCGLHTKEYDYFIVPTMRTILVEIDKKTLKPVRKTNVMCIDNENHSRIQFLSGLEIDESYVYLSYGIGDYISTVRKIPKHHIETLLT